MNRFTTWFSQQLKKSPKTQSQIAQECCVQRSYIVMLKSEGKNQRLPMPGTLFLLALALDVDVEEAFVETGIEMPLAAKQAWRDMSSRGPFGAVGLVHRMEIEIAALKASHP